ncbi:Precorrin-6B methylase 2 [Geoglobus ahangari]|uniref:Precorrin-6B methylase 2 n=1 Tax=Geoglobus ahangari TaxID=113653 RepID=A0A0F7IDU0_9EURY|nr:rRNA adenine N-6-methyltransferase family protein [Geoglobus ahangari]AKG91078.1 Precorrin-6B methylase 2 [Geoglobus ahangari]
MERGKFTKDEVVGVVFSKLRPDRDWVVADIGSGSGRVAEFLSEYVRLVYAVELDPNLSESLRQKFAGSNVEVVNSHGYDFLVDHEVDAVFFGGTKGIERMLEVCRAKRVVVNCARMDVAVAVVRKMKELGIFREVVMVSASHGYELAGGIAFRAINPVFVVVGDALRS